MADEEIDNIDDNEEEPKKGKKKLIIILVIALIVIIGGGAGAFFMLSGDKAEQTNEEWQEYEDEEIIEGADSENGADGALIDTGPVFYEMDEFIVNLNTGGKQVRFLKMKVVLELSNDLAVADVEEKLPRIRDSFQIYLRELRVEDMQGSGGIYRLKEELMFRINKEIYPTNVSNILFRDVLVQ